MIMDTDVHIEIQRNHPPALNWLASLQIVPCISGFAAMELFADRANLTELKIAQKFVAKFPVMWPDEASLSQALNAF